MNNYLARLLGLALRRLREPLSSSSVADYLQIHDSKYRLIESGGQILDPELVVPLKQIEAFKEVQADRLSLFISYCYFLQESINRGKRGAINKSRAEDSKVAAKNAINTLIGFDVSVELFLNPNIVQEPASDYDSAVTNLIIFLTKKPMALDDDEKISRLRMQLWKIEDDTLCVFNPHIKSNINGINKDLDNLGNFKSINNQIDDLSNKIQGIKDLKLGFDTINAPEFIKVHNYQEIKGTISNPENLLNQHIIDNYSSYMKQVWSKSFTKSIKFIFLSEDEDRLRQIVSEYLNKKMYDLYFSEYNEKKGEHFQNGIQKIGFRYIKKEDELVKGMLGNHNEFWFYHSIDNDGKDFKDGIEYGFMTYSISEQPEIDNFKYKILTNREVRESDRAFNLTWNAALPII
jgi:hypothetical protein